MKQKRSVARRHQLRIARETLHMPDAIAKIMGGMTKEEARKIVGENRKEEKK